MPQDPFLVDQIDIEPGSVGTRRISRDATGGLKFTDPVATGGILLSQLASLRAIANVFVVGKSGLGARFTTIQEALDEVPASASATSPYIILVMPGRYDETINIVRDGVYLVGLGQPEIRSALEATPDAAGADHTLIISAQLGTIPLYTLIQGFKISNVHTTKAAIRIVGAAASTVLSTGLYLLDCDVRADSAAGNYSLYGTTAGRIEARQTVFGGSDAFSQILLQEMSEALFYQCEMPNGFNFRYDTANDEPDSGVGDLALQNCQNMVVDSSLSPAMSIDCDGQGSSGLYSCSMSPTQRLQYSGDQTHYARISQLGILSVLETVSIETKVSKYASLLAGNLSAELDVDVVRGTVVLAAAATGAIAFDIPFTDADFQVDLELPSRPANDETPWVTLKLATGFTVNFQTAQTMTVLWTATRS